MFYETLSARQNEQDTDNEPEREDDGTSIKE